MRTRFSIRVGIVGLLGLFLSGAVTNAAPPLAEQAPADTLVYVGWAGGDTLKPTYDNSNLSAVFNQTNLPQLLDQYLPKLWDSMGGPRQQADHVRQIATILSHHPAAWYLQAMPKPIGPQSSPRFGLVCDAGADAPTLVQLLRGLGPRALGPNTRVT